MPSARFYQESSHGITLYSGDPDHKISMSSSPFDWLEASLFYVNINNKPYARNLQTQFVLKTTEIKDLI